MYIITFILTLILTLVIIPKVLQRQNYSIAIPSKPKVLIISNNTVELSWTVPRNNATSFTVLYRQRSDPSGQWNRVDTTTTRVKISKLLKYATYIFKVRAQCSGMYGQYSEMSEANVVCDTKDKSDNSDSVVIEAGIKAQKQSAPTAVTAKEYSQIIKTRSHGLTLYDPVTERKKGEVMKCTIGRQMNTGLLAIPTMNERILLLIGATGTGKSTLINGIANFVLGVHWEDDFRFKVIRNGRSSQAHSQTKKITAYTFVKSILPYTLTVIDTPGFGDTRGIQQDKILLNQIDQLFSNSKAHYSIDQIHGIGFVASATDARLTQTQKYVFNSILSIFGKDIASNVFVLMTFADEQSPPLLSALKEADIQYQAGFKFNNSSLYATHESDIDEMFWKLGSDNFTRFFSEFEKVEACSLQLTRETLKTRQQLEALFEGLKVQISAGLTKIEALRRKLQVLEERKADILNNKTFAYDVTITKQRQVSLSNERFVTNCLKCNFTCHYPCSIEENNEKYRCIVMNGCDRSSAYCTVCPGKCHWSEHANQPYHFEIYYKSEVFMSDGLFGKTTKGKKKPVEAIIASIESELDVWHDFLIQNIRYAQQNEQKLQKIALKPGSHSNIGYIDFLISSEKAESDRNPDFEEHIKTLTKIKQKMNEKRVAVRADSCGKRSISLWRKCIT